MKGKTKEQLQDLISDLKVQVSKLEEEKAKLSEIVNEEVSPFITKEQQQALANVLSLNAFMFKNGNLLELEDARSVLKCNDILKPLIEQGSV